MPKLFRNYGSKIAGISNYLKQIEQNLIPSINNTLGTNINNYPRITRETYVVYEDNQNDIRLELSSNHREIENKGELFGTISYNGMAEDIGIIDINDIDSAVEIILSTMKELDYKTPEEIEDEKRQEELERQRQEEERQAQIEKDKARKRELQQEIKDKEEREKEEPEESEEEKQERLAQEKADYERKIPDIENEVNRTFDYINDLNDIGEIITAEWSFIPEGQEGSSLKMTEIALTFTHAAGNNYLLESKRIKPKVEKMVTSEEALNYIMKVSNKMQAGPLITMKDSKGKDMKLPAEYNGDAVDIDFDI